MLEETEIQVLDLEIHYISEGKKNSCMEENLLEKHNRGIKD